MSAQPSHVTTLETIEHLDFEHEPPCELVGHAGASKPAMFVVAVSSHCLGHFQRLICLTCWERGLNGVYCLRCGLTRPREVVWTIVRVIGSTS